jgi:hypothetical protein
MVLFIVNEHWTNSDNSGGIYQNFFINYDKAYEFYQKLEKKIYNNNNGETLFITFENDIYLEHMTDNYAEIGYSKEDIESFTIDNVYDYLNKSIVNQFVIKKIKLNGEYKEYEISEEGYFKRPSAIELKVLDEESMNNPKKKIVLYKLPLYKTY